MIPTVQEPKKLTEFPMDACCFCRAGTRSWTKIAARPLGEQVACCQGCAKTHKVAEVPSKDEWFKAERDRDRERRRRAGVRV